MVPPVNQDLDLTRYQVPQDLDHQLLTSRTVRKSSSLSRPIKTKPKILYHLPKRFVPCVLTPTSVGDSQFPHPPGSWDLSWVTAASSLHTAHVQDSQTL
jgi:hypothetical protein